MPGPAVVAGAFNLADKLLDLGDQFIEDKDKKAEYAFEIAKMTNDFSVKVLSAQTIPWVDALVKILYAIRDVVIPLLRPLGSAALSMWGAWATSKGIEVGADVPAAAAAAIGAFPGWMTSRHFNKNNEAKEETKRHVVSEKRRAMQPDPFMDLDHG